MRDPPFLFATVAYITYGCGFPGVREIINHYSEIANA